MKKFIIIPIILLSLSLFANDLSQIRSLTQNKILSLEKKIELFLNDGKFIKDCSKKDCIYIPTTNLHSIHIKDDYIEVVTVGQVGVYKYNFSKTDILLDGKHNLIIAPNENSSN